MEKTPFDAGLRLGIDLGGTKIEALLMRDSGEEVLRRRIPTPREDYDGTVRAIAGLAASVEAEAGGSCATMGVGIPGSVSPATGLVRNGNTTWINGRAFDRDLAVATGKKVRVENDGNCLALSEAVDGAAAGAASVCAVILGTGFGGGIVIDGRIVAGAHGIGGELGHFPQPLAPDDPGNADLCWCGRSTCGETYVTGPAIMREYVRRKGLSPDEPIDVRTIHERAEAGEAEARAVLEQHLDRVARALGVVVSILDPAVFVLGGGVSNLPHIVERLPEAMAPHIFADPDDAVRVKVVKAKFGDSSGVRGAARLLEP